MLRAAPTAGHAMGCELLGSGGLTAAARSQGAAAALPVAPPAMRIGLGRMGPPPHPGLRCCHSNAPRACGSPPPEPALPCCARLRARRDRARRRGREAGVGAKGGLRGDTAADATRHGPEAEERVTILRRRRVVRVWPGPPVYTLQSEPKLLALHERMRSHAAPSGSYVACVAAPRAHRAVLVCSMQSFQPGMCVLDTLPVRLAVLSSLV